MNHAHVGPGIMELKKKNYLVESDVCLAGALPRLAPILLLQSRLEISAVWGLRNLRATWGL